MATIFDYHIVRLFVPNSWKNIRNLYKDYSFYFSSKKFDNKLNRYYLELIPSCKFYDAESGHTYIICPGKRPKILLNENPDKEERKLFLLKHGYSGYMTDTSKEHKKYLFRNLIFYLVPGTLQLSKREELCPLINIAIEENENIIRKNPQFPGIEEIQAAIADKSIGPSGVCKILFKVL